MAELASVKDYPKNKNGLPVHPPFNKETGAAAGRKRATARRSDAVRDAMAAKELIKMIHDEGLELPSSPDAVVKLARHGLIKTLLVIAAGQVKPRTAAEAVNVARALHEIVRLQDGQATTITGTQTREQIEAQVKQLQQVIEERRTGRAAGA